MIIKVNKTSYKKLPPKVGVVNFRDEVYRIKVSVRS